MMTKESLEKTFNRRFDSSGHNWKAKCPFHADGNERTPSFYVHKEEYVAQCFGCGASGYIHVLASWFTGLSTDACEALLHITVAEKVRDRLDRVGREPERRPTRYSEALLAGWKREIHAYTVARGFTFETLKRSGTRYDSSEQRQVFPWRTQDGVLRGATGRTTCDHPAKWKHYWEFDKGKWLYEIPPRAVGSTRGDTNLAVSPPSSLRQPNMQQRLLVVEGIFDLLWVVQEGHYENVVAPATARLTYEQAKQIKERTNHVIIAFDNDEAGIRGSAAAYRQLKDSCVVEFVCWPAEAKDWMDLDAEAIETVLSTTTGYVGWRNKLRQEGRVDLTDDPREIRKRERANRLSPGHGSSTIRYE